MTVIIYIYLPIILIYCAVAINVDSYIALSKLLMYVLYVHTILIITRILRAQTSRAEQAERAASTAFERAEWDLCSALLCS